MDRIEVKTSFRTMSYLHRSGKLQVLSLHGLGGTGNSSINLNSYLDQRFELFMSDLLGLGRSGKPNIDYTMEYQCISITEFLETANIKLFAVVGNSYGVG